MSSSGNSDRPNPADIQVVGLGLSRTGTMSLATALGQIGFGPCYHLLAHSSKAGEARLWDEVFHPTETTNVSRCLDEIFTKFDKRQWKSACDIPSNQCPEAMYAAYPNAKFILTLRDKEKWYPSWVVSVENSPFEPSRTDDNVSDSRKNFVESFVRYSWCRFLSYDNYVSNDILRDISLEMPFGPDPLATGMQKFDEHTERVKRAIPADQLLIHNMGDGWDPLCKFLGGPIPNEPYPRTNDSQAFRDNVYDGYFYPALPMFGSVAAVIIGGISYLVFK